ncbi:methyl-CpG-binding domain-containing protein 2-like [Nymphaea colorata]|nr:methyl-CpG-binding domain-containing protein 2-like [Nymphaea colorata]
MTSAWRPLPPQDHDHLLENAEVVAPLSVQVPGNGSHSDAEQSVRGESSAGHVDDREKDCCCQTSRCRCSARTGLFAVQCSACFKWRLIPSKRVYEDIRQAVLVDPFVCDKAKKWNPHVSCAVPDDIQPSEDMIWGIDDPIDAPEPPPGWERLLRIRNRWWDYRFADVFYVAPNGKRVRSKSEVERFFTENPEYVREGVHINQFSFYAPKPQLNSCGFYIPS